MAGLKIHIGFWYLDESLIGEIISLLKEGNFEPVAYSCRAPKQVEDQLRKDAIDLVIADFDLPESLRTNFEQLHRELAFHLPFIYVVGEKNESKAAESLKRGVWDYLLKSHLIKLIPTVYSSQKYGKVLKRSMQVEDELLESELKYRTIFNSVHDGMILIHPETLEIEDFNDSIYSLFGIDENEERSEVIDFLKAAFSNKCKEQVALLSSAENKDQPITFSCWNNNLKREGFWTENTLSRFQMKDTFRYLVVVKDVQDQRQMEESLNKSREHFRNLAENSPDVIMRFDQDFRHTYVNKTVKRQTGLDVDLFLNKSHEEMGVFPSEMIEFWEKGLQTCWNNAMPHKVEFDFDQGDRIISFEWRLFPEMDEDGAVQSILAIARDVTQEKQTREEIRMSEERLQLAVNATSLGLWDWDVKNDSVYFSPIYFSMLGYAPGDLPSTFETWERLLHEEDRTQTLKTVMACVERKETSFELEFRLLCKDGSYKWILAKGKVTGLDPAGNVLRFIGTHEDITSRKHNELIQQVLFNISNAVNTTKNLDELYEHIRQELGKIVDTTNCFLALYNAEKQVLTMPFHRDEVDSFSEFPVGKTLTGYVVSTGETQLINEEREAQLTRDGFIEPVGSPCVSWLGVPLRNHSQIIGVFVVQSYKEEVVYTQKDVSILEFVSDQIALAIERKRDQDSVVESQERQRRIFESSPDPIVVVDTKGLITDYNSSLLKTLGVTTEPVVGQNIFRLIHKTQWRRVLSSFQRTWDLGYLKNIQFDILKTDGTFFPAEISSGAIYGNDGAPESMVIILKDISERKEAERNLMEAKDRAEESDRLKTAFLSNMSHEIRTPMNAIVGFSDLLNDASISQAERNEFIAQINLGAENLMHLIDDIIDISKIEAGQIKINRHPVKIKDLLNDQLVMIRQNAERMDKGSIEFRLDWRCENSELVLSTDPFRLKQVVTNLLNNALKFTEKGHVEIRVERVDEMVQFTVADTGIGIDPEKQKLIFERFMQGHSSKTKLYGGTGLGLAISRNLVMLLGGTITVNSVPGEGSEFCFNLPHLKVDFVERQPESRNLAISRKWIGKTILVAEDDVANYGLISEVLKQTKMKLLWAKNGVEAVELYKDNREKIDLVLMDIRMPEMDGYESTRQIKKMNPQVPVIAQTAYAMSGEKEQSREAGCDDYISKPLQIKNFIDKIGHYLS